MLKISCYWRQLFWLWLSAAILVLDQLTKKAALDHLANQHSINVLQILDFSLAFNYGAAFGFLNTPGSWQSLFFLGVACSVALVMVVWILCHRQVGKNASVALIIGGALGNAWDRVHAGCVTDFIDLHFGTHHWPLFNFADSAICVGVSLLLLFNLLHKQ